METSELLSQLFLAFQWGETKCACQITELCAGGEWAKERKLINHFIARSRDWLLFARFKSFITALCALSSGNDNLTHEKKLILIAQTDAGEMLITLGALAKASTKDRLCKDSQLLHATLRFGTIKNATNPMISGKRFCRDLIVRQKILKHLYAKRTETNRPLWFQSHPIGSLEVASTTLREETIYYLLHKIVRSSTYIRCPMGWRQNSMPADDVLCTASSWYLWHH